MKISALSVNSKAISPSFTKKLKENNVQNPVSLEAKPKSKLKKALPVIAAVGLTAAGVGAGYYIASKKGSVDKKAMLALLSLAGFGGFSAGKIDKKELNEKLDSIIKNESPNQKTFNENNSSLSEIRRTQINPTLNKHSDYYNDILLLKQNNVLNRNAQKYAKAIDTIQNIGFEKLTSKNTLAPIQTKNPTIWSITSEFAPMKEGGLGSVPPEIRNNAEKLGINMPTFIPMYLSEGKASLVKEGINYKYIYKGNEMELDKLATIKMDVYKNGKTTTIPVSFYLYPEAGENGKEKQLIFIQADDYFDGTIYEASSKSEEPEKFAVMSKAVYEFAKLKMEGVATAKNIEIFDEYSLDQIKQPDGMILNDWQASPTAALLRYKAVMENAHGQISDSTAQKLKDMRVITIGHNVMYQGSTQNDNNYHQKKSATSNILNTLFDKYAYDIVTNAKSGATSIDPNDKGLEALDNVLLMDHKSGVENYTNFLNMGIILSDYFNPVSKNYAKELISPKHRELSNMLQWALVQKNNAGKLVGIINGNDFNGLSIEAKAPRIKSATSLNFETYKKSDSIEEIKEKRENNKISLYQDFAMPFAEASSCDKAQIDKIKKVSSALEFVKGAQGTKLPQLTNEQLKDTPVLMSGGRLVSQKGVDVLCDAIEMLFDNWEVDFPNKNKPIFYIAGSDGEGGSQRKLIEDLKDNKLSKEDNNRILFAHGFAPMPALMAGADFFLMPSKFEPCGLTQGESLALATPVIASAVGGIVDTINRDGKFNGILTDQNETLTAQGYYEAMKKGLNIFFNDKEKYTNMVKDSIAEDFSWAKNGQGPVYDYLNLLGVQV